MGVLNKIKEGKPAGAGSDPVLTRIVQEDTTSWIKKRNLRNLYFLLVPAAIGIEITSGFDSQLINALQIVPSWIKCKNAVGGSTELELTCLARLRQPSGLLEGHHCRRIFARCYYLFTAYSHCR
jgi:hypothetical protein